MTRVQFGTTSLVALTLALGGCSQQARANPPTQAVAPPATAVAGTEPPVVAQPGTPLPPTPAPATFDVAALSDQVKPMVVNITTTHEVDGAQGIDPFEFFFGPGARGGGGGRSPERHLQQTALGTGFIIDRGGYVITNEHVVHDADEVRVKLADEREFTADVVGRDPKLDLALLKLEGAKDLPAAVLGSSEQLRVGEHVLAVGNPFGLGHTVTLGIVSAKARSLNLGQYDDFIQTDASINPGNSGGPLFNWKGEVIGINTAIRAGANGIGFAIPVDALKDVLPQLREKGHVERGKLGVVIQPITPDLAKALDLEAPRGALVAELEPNGPGARAGIKPGDVIVAVNGVTINHMEELPRNVARNAPGTAVKVSIVRNKQRQEVTAKLDPIVDENPAGARPAKAPHPAGQSAGKLGIQISDAQGGGVRVDEISGSNVRELAPGDVIVELNGTPVKDTQDLRTAAAKVKPGTVALMKVRRGRVVRFAGVPIPK